MKSLNRSTCVRLFLTCIFLCEAAFATRRYVYITTAPASKIMVLAKSDQLRSELALTAEQSAAIERMDTDLPTAPEITDFSRSFNSLGKTLSQSGRKRATDAAFAILNIADEEQTTARLQKILTASQYARFMQIYLQVYGPAELLRSSSLSFQSPFSKEKERRMRELIAEHDRKQEDERKKLGRYVVSGEIGDLDDGENSEDLAEDLCKKMETAERVLDDKLLEMMTEEERDLWREFQGKEAVIEWDNSTFSSF